MRELLVGLPAVRLLGIDHELNEALRVHVECSSEKPFCESRGLQATLKDRAVVHLVDLSSFGRPARLVWHKRRWRCADEDCPTMGWTEEDARIAHRRMAMTDRAGRWVTEQVGRYARSVNEVAVEIGCDWHTVNDAVLAYGEAIVDDEDRFGIVAAPSLDVAGTPVSASASAGPLTVSVSAISARFVLSEFATHYTVQASDQAGLTLYYSWRLALQLVDKAASTSPLEPGSEAVLDEALTSLGTLRSVGWVRDAGVDLHLLMSLIEEATGRLPRAVADARDQDLSWAEIADLLGATRASTWQRYAGHTKDNRTPVED